MIPGLFLAALLAAQPAAAAPPAPPVAATPPSYTTDWPPRSLFTADDYPAAALRAEHEGTVRYRLEIGPNGRVSRCAITSSSGSAALDTATCRIISARCRFMPARDSEGNWVPDTRESEMTWRLDPDD